MLPSLGGLLLSAALVQGQTVTAVNFDASANLTGGNTISGFTPGNDTTGDYDFDGSEDDRATSLTFGTVFNPSNHPNYNPPVGQSDSVFYQGLSLARIGDTATAAPAVALNRMSSTLVQIGNTAASSSETFRIASAFYWKSEDFLNGSIELANEAASIQFTGSSVAGNWEAHALIETGGKWYVSGTSKKTTLSINGAAETWYEFDPVGDVMFWDEANKGVGVTGSTLGELTAAGVYFQETYTGSTPRWHFESLSFSGTSIPEPGSYALLAGLAGLCFVILRRRN